MIEACDFFIWSVSNELHLRETLNKETITKLENFNKELKNDLSKKTEALESKLKQTETEKAHLLARESTLKE